jgi:branched-subunit amino acid transport protein
MNEFLLITGMALVTFAVRYPVLVLIGKIPLPDSLFRALRYVPPAVLAAIIAPGVLAPNGDIQIAPENSPLVASVVAVIVAWRTKNLLLTIIIGMAALLVWRSFV